MAGGIKDIRYEGDNRTFIWKSPIEDFSLGSRITVGPSQEALFVNNGQALDLFPSGSHVLKTSNIPLLRKVYEGIYEGNTPFHCSVFFINKIQQMAMQWGTDTQIEYMDRSVPEKPLPFKMGLSGEMSLMVGDSRKLIEKVAVLDDVFNRETLQKRFNGFLMSHMDYVVQVMEEQQINIFEVDGKRREIAEGLKTRLIPDFEEYGISLTQFMITRFVKPENDRNYVIRRDLFYRKVNEIDHEKLRQEKELIAYETEMKKKIMNAETEAGAMDISSEAIARKRQREGYSYQQEKGFEVAMTAAGNESSGQFTNLGIGLGAMTGIGGAVGGALGSAMSDAFQPGQTGMSGASAQPASSSPDPFEVLTKLKALLDNSLITQEQYDQKAAEVLERM